MLCLVDKRFTSSSSEWPRVLTCPWETCSFIDSPSVVIALPQYGGTFTVVYVRQLWHGDQTVLIALQTSEDIHIHAPILFGNPLRLTSDPLIRRRGVTPVLNSLQVNDHMEFQVVMEYFKNIDTLSIHCTVTSSDLNLVHLNRFKCWLFSDEKSYLFIEVDICSKDMSSKCNILKLVLPDELNYLQYEEARVTLSPDMSTINIRFPCTSNVSSTLSQIINDIIPGTISCAFCSNVIVPGNSIQKVRSMPTGLFDHVM